MKTKLIHFKERSYTRSLFIAICLLLSAGMYAQVGIGTDVVGDGAMMDISATDKAILIPKVNITDTTTLAPVTEEMAAVESLLVYNTNATTGKGFYYWDGSDWILIGVNVLGGNDWKIIGNAGTSIATHYLGTADDHDYIFRTNGVERMRLTYDGLTGESRLGVGTDTPDERVDVNGDMEMGGADIRHDNQGENIYIRPTRNTWYMSVVNDPDPLEAHFFIGDNADNDDFAIKIDPVLGRVSIGNDDYDPNDALHVTDDQNATTSIRIDNDNIGVTGVPSTSLEFWQGATEKAFIRNINTDGVLEIGHALASGQIDFYLSSSHAMNLSSTPSTVNMFNDLTVSGNISKGGGTFKIDHPLDPTNKYLYHSFVESPDMMNIYDGIIETNDAGEAIIELPSYFIALNRDFQYQFTTIGSFSRVKVVNEIADNKFVIKTETPNVKVSWQVTGIRQDPYANKNRVIPEVNKENKIVTSTVRESGSISRESKK